QRFAAEECEDEPFGVHTVELALDPAGDARSRLERHLLRKLVVVAVIALKAVIAGEIALQRREHSDIELRRIVRDLLEVTVEGVAIVIASWGYESVFNQLIERSARLDVQDVRIDLRVEQRGNVRRHNRLSIRQRVHQKHVVTFERHTKVESRSLHTA